MVRVGLTLFMSLFLSLGAPAAAVAHEVDEQDHHWQSTQASWYGPKFYGKGTACGHLYSREIRGVAKLGGTKRDCGKLVRLKYRGREVVVRIIDTGPRHRGRLWDLSRKTCEDLGRCYTDRIEFTY